MTNKEAKNKLIARIEEYFEKTGEVGFPELDLSEFKGDLDLTRIELGGNMHNYKIKIKGYMDNRGTKIGKTDELTNVLNFILSLNDDDELRGAIKLLVNCIHRKEGNNET